MKPPLEGGAILITGASSGIGREMAGALASKAGSLILVARREEKLKELAAELCANHPGLKVHIRSCDLADREALESLMVGLERDIGQVDVLINNAGIGHLAFLADADPGEIDRMIQLNVVSLTYLAQRLLPGMIARRRGGILNVSSLLGLIVLPGQAAYCGTKHYVTGLSRSLRAEANGTGVVVSQLCPGPVKSAFWDLPNAGQLGPPGLLFISVGQCVREGLRGFARGRALIVPGLKVRLFRAFMAVTPPPIERLVLSLIARSMRVKPVRTIAAGKTT